MRPIAVRQLPKDPGPAAWNAIVPARTPTAALDGRHEADLLAIGAGFAGLAAPRRAAQLDLAARVVVLEARAVAQRPAGRNSGFMIDLPHDLTSHGYGGAVDHDMATIRANRAAIDFAAGMAEDFGLGAEAFTRSGKINAAVSARGMTQNAAFAAHLAELGEAHRLMDGAEMQALTGTDYYRGGLFTPGTAMIQPALFVRGVAAGIVSNRVQLYEMSPVTALERQGETWRASTPGGLVMTPRVILVVNGHAASFGFVSGRLMHVFTYASMTRALTAGGVARLGGVARWGVTPADPMGTTVRRISGTGGDRIVVRNRFTFDPAMEVSAARVARDHDRAFAARFGMLAGVGMAYRWAGRLCLGRNDAPAFGEVALGQRSPLLSDMLAQPGPLRLPPAPLARIGAGAVMRWGEWRAGPEVLGQSSRPDF